MARTANDRMFRRPAHATAARPMLVIVGLSLALLVVLYGIWATGRTADLYRYVAGLQGVPPFVAALFALGRIADHARRGEGSGERRYLVGLAVFALGLLAWALAEFGLLGEGFVAATLPLYPSWLDIGPVVAIICWTAAIFITLEGHVDEQGRRFDVVEAINAHAEMLAIFLGANVALLAIFHGADFKLLLSTNGGPLTVGYALDILYTTTDIFLVWMTVTLVHGEPGRSM